MTHADEARINIEIDGATALVLFDLLARFELNDNIRIRDNAERCALWLLHGALERRLVTPLAPDYAKRIKAARAELQRRFGE